MDIISYKKFLFKEIFDINEDEWNELEPFKNTFIEKKDDFANNFYDFFIAISETKNLIESLERPDHLKNAWAKWFELLLTRNSQEFFSDYLWRIGIKHVDVNLDQRYSNVGFSLARRFCQEIIQSDIPLDNRQIISNIVDKRIDYCILVETNAYIEHTTRCDLEIIRGIADRIRNRITIIGGNLKRLQKKINYSEPEYNIYETLILESSSCENMVNDIKVYVDMSIKESEIRMLSLEEIISRAIDRLQIREKFKNINLDIQLDPKGNIILGDKEEIENVFFYLLQNCLEAIDIERPLIRISSFVDESIKHLVRIEIFNTGIPPRSEDIVRMFSPFYSTKQFGTGFGLSIARLAVRKNNGRISIVPIYGEGTKVILTLRIPEPRN